MIIDEGGESMAGLLKKFNKKTLYVLGGILGVGLLAFGIKTVTYEVKVSSLKKTHSIKFDDIKKDYNKDTGLIDSEIEKVLNKKGIFDFEIKRLDDMDINELKKCKNVEDISVDKMFYGINNASRRGYEGYDYGFSLDELSGKEVLVENRDFYSLANIVYRVKDDSSEDKENSNKDKKQSTSKTKNNKKEKIIYKSVSICTYYNMPEKLGHDMFVYCGDSWDVKNYNIARAYGVYDVSTYKDISATKLRKKESYVNLKIPHLTSRVIDSDLYEYKKILFITDKLFKYLDLEKVSDWKAAYKDLRRKEIDFIKVNNASFIVSVEQEMKEERRKDSIYVNVEHRHQVENTHKMYEIPSSEKKIQESYYMMDGKEIGNQSWIYKEDYDVEDYNDEEIDWEESWDDIKSEEIHYID